MPFCAEGKLDALKATFLIREPLDGVKMLGIAEDSFVMKNLENALVWRSRSASIKGNKQFFIFQNS